MCGRLERTLRFPRNNSADSTDSHVCFTSQLAIARAYGLQCASVLPAAFDLDEPVGRQAFAASNQAYNFHSDLRSFKSQAASFLDKVKERVLLVNLALENAMPSLSPLFL
jgi:hypothetical protein